eukprot:scaffold4402_cov338-Prasinococcus_capsulatus_cf.AAC.2
MAHPGGGRTGPHCYKGARSRKGRFSHRAGPTASGDLVAHCSSEAPSVALDVARRPSPGILE